MLICIYASILHKNVTLVHESLMKEGDTDELKPESAADTRRICTKF